MSRWTRQILALLLMAGPSAVSCRSAHPDQAPSTVQPGAPGTASRVVPRARVAAQPTSEPTAADVSFMQNMIGHHAQAVEMVALLTSRTMREDMRLLGLRIQVSQSDEMRMMERWLEVHGQALPGPHAHHGEGGMLMPGMLTPAEMASLAAASGPAFDRLFLEGMIRHHEGALAMVKALFTTPGAGQDAEMFAFASDVDADQRMEIDRMRALLNTP